MGARFIAVIMFFAATVAWAGCTDCHKPHYEAKGSCTACHRGVDGTSRMNVAHLKIIPAEAAYFMLESPRVKEGEKISELAGCRRCHVIGGKGTGYSANLTTNIKTADIKEYYRQIDEPAEFMPEFHLSKPDIYKVLNYLLKTSVNMSRADAAVQVINFRSGAEGVFEKECAPCHKAITPNLGPLGKYANGYNLSGLLSGYYPKTEGVKQWNRQELEKWLKNPRKVRKNAAMQPKKLNHKELSELMKTLGGG